MSDIRFIHHTQIDKDKWNNCVQNDKNAKCYNLYDYVNILASNWIGVVYGDYEAVLALPYKHIGIKFLYTPPFIQHFDIVGNVDIYVKHKIAENVFNKFKLGTIRINFFNKQKEESISRKVNFYIDLSQSYEEIQANYSKACIKNLKKADKNILIEKSNDINALIEFYKNAYGSVASYKEKHYFKFSNLIELLIKQNIGHIYRVTSDNIDIFYTFIVNDGKRLYYLLGAPNQLGRTKRVTYSFLDWIIRNNAHSNLIFDFEGSEIENVAHFYKKFGPQTEYYYNYKINKLPKFFNKLINKIL